MTHMARQPQEETIAPISWSPDSITVEKILRFCEYEVARIRSPKRKQSGPNRYLDAREAILERIYGNLRNVIHRSYPAEISFKTVTSDLTKNFDNSAEGRSQKAVYVAALKSEWGQLCDHFKRHFTKHDPD